MNKKCVELNRTCTKDKQYKDGKNNKKKRKLKS